jgi:hypothetical protein
MRSSRRPLLVLSLLGMAIAVPALAQTSSGYPAACEASKVSKIESDRAHTVFLSGKGFLDESNYDKAISYFKDAYSIDCSVHGILPIIATAYERKGDKASAVDALEEYLRRVPTAPDRDVVERRIRNLKDQIGQAATTTTATATGTATTAPTGTALPSGTTEPTATAPTATATAPEPPAPPPSGHTALPWIVAGAGVAVLAAGVVMYAVGDSDVTSAAKTCGGGHSCPQTPAGNSAVSTGNTGRTLEGVGVGAGIAGILGVAGGIVWHFTEHPASGQVAVTPVVAPGYAGVGLGGSF